MKFRKNILIIGLLGFVFSSMAQNNEVKKANQKFEDLAFIDALEIYENVAKEGYEDEAMFMKLGDGYYFIADYVQAAKWYGKLAQLNAKMQPEYLFRYGQSLKALGDYSQADVLLNRFYRTQGLSYSISKDYLKDIEASSDKYVVEKASFNTEYSDYPAFVKGDNLYVVSGSDNGKTNPWNNEPASDIFLLNGNNLNYLKGDLNTKFNEGSMAITNDGNTLYFTRNDFNGKKRGRDSNKTTRLKLYKAEKVEGEWKNITEVPFNSSEYSVGHPALNLDNTKLYFVSDMPGNGNQGGTDIYEVSLNTDGSFGTPKNMAAINTPGNEMFPFIAEDLTLYFASNGQIANLGGLDVYSATPDESGRYVEVVNVGKPINSPMDDFAFLIKKESETGYLASNRGGTLSDDVFSFKRNPNYYESNIITYRGVIRDERTRDILENVLVSLVDANNNIIESKTVDAGLYQFEVEDLKNARFVRAEKNGYQTGEEILVAAVDGVSSKDVFLTQRKIDLSEGTDLGLLLNPIYFDYAKYNILPEAEIELQKIIAILKSKPNVKIDVRSHTDSRAPDAYNMRLSNRRVRSTIAYFVSAGIDRSRISGRGYGESEIKNGCTNGVSCTEAEHRLNRRSEFIIVK